MKKVMVSVMIAAFLTIALSSAGKGGDSKITMTTTWSQPSDTIIERYDTIDGIMNLVTITLCEFTIGINWKGEINGTIDWGDGKVEKINECPKLLVVREDKLEYFEFSHAYNSSSPNTITISSENITFLRCRGYELTNLDVSKNMALTYLDCYGNQLTDLDVSKNTALTYLDCSDNWLTNLDVSKNTALTVLKCKNKWKDIQLTNLDVSKNIALTELYCYGNQLTNLDVSKNMALTYLYCSRNQLTNLDLSKNESLTNLDCSDNWLTNLDVRKNTELSEFSCARNQLTDLDVSKNLKLTDLYCNENQLTDLDVSKNVELNTLSCSGNEFSCDVLNALFETLHSNTYQYGKKISVSFNPGSQDCNTEIAKNKGWLMYKKLYLNGGWYTEEPEY
jgi:hypothetical protein